MTTDINSFITFSKGKNDRVKVTQSIVQETNLYNFLHELGFCQTMIDNKRHFYQRVGDDIIPRKLFQIKNAFVNFIKSVSFSNLSQRITPNDILNWYYENNPIKNNCLFLECLRDELSETDQNILKRKTGSTYAKNYETQQLLGKFQEWEFKKTIDIPGNFLSGSDIYYKNIGGNDFLVFNNFESKSGLVVGFDTWLATFNSERLISKSKTNLIRQIKLNFHLNKDFDLISKYIS
jgi:hypothetical protein